MTDPTCGCSTPARLTPGTVTNRPGLPVIAYRSGTHREQVASMLVALAEHPALAGLRTRDADDPAIALLDAFAVSADVLTFYTERLAHESFLRTATERASLALLGSLIGFRPAPGVAAETWLAFSMERPPVAPVAATAAAVAAGRPRDPGMAAPAVPDTIALPVGLRVRSVPGPGESPVTFETVDPIEARPEWNALPVVSTTPNPPTFGHVDAWLAGSTLGILPGQAILFASADLVGDRWDVRRILAAEPDLPAERTYVRWDRGLGSVHPPNNPAVSPDAFVLRRRLPVFGHSAPLWRSMSDQFRTDYAGESGKDDADWPGFGSLTADGDIAYIDLDGAQPDVVPGAWVVVSQEGGGAPFYRELYEVLECAEVSRAAFGLSGRVTRLKLRGETGTTFATPRDVTVLAVADPVTVVEAPDDSVVGGPEVIVAGDATAMAPGRTVLLAGVPVDGNGDPAPVGTPSVEVLVVHSVTAQPAARTRVTFERAATGLYERASAMLLGNVARATHGESVSEILGDGDARVPFRTFTLRQGPITHVPVDTPTGAESTLAVEVDGLRWHERVTSYGAGPADRIVTTRDEPDTRVSVVFGDGVQGARPATGSANVRARFRVGLGVAGNVRADQLSQPMDRPLGLSGVTNPLPATGGADPQGEESTRTAIPRPVRTLGRAVSLTDHADFAMAYPGIGRAIAEVLVLRGGRAIVVTVADPAGGAPPARTCQRLVDSLRAAGDPLVRVEVVPAHPVDVRASMGVTVDPDRDPDVVLAAVSDAVLGAFHRSVREIGAPVHASAVIAVAAGVLGVVGVDLDALYRADQPSTREEHVVAEAASVAGDGHAVAGELLGVTGFDVLEAIR